MKTYFGLSNQLVWLKIDNSLHRADEFIIIVDEENFVKIINQAIDLANNTIANKS